MSGGSGSRLWPLSRELHPKQLLPLTGSLSLLQETLRRVSDPARFAPPLLICGHEHRFAVAEQLRQIGAQPLALVLEPEGRNTAPAAAVAADLLAAEAGPDALVLMLPSDHLILDGDGFLAAVDVAAAAAGTGAMAAFGIRPTRPETGYGYIRRDRPLDRVAGAFEIARFVEKPDAATAEAYLAAGDYSWNSGMFLFQAGRLLAELTRLEPDMLEVCRRAVAESERDLDFRRLAPCFSQAASRSFDVAVMERTRHGVVVPVEIGWSDVGSWSALAELAPQDDAGNTVRGDAIAVESEGVYLRSEGILTAVVGLKDAVVVATADAVLVAAKSRAQEVREVVRRLRAAGRSEHLSPRRVHRPWGWHETVEQGDRFKVKQIMVEPGQSLSLQKHLHRAEHWVVVQGVAEVSRGDDRLLVHENESVFIPLGAVHRLHNPGKLPLRLIEVQTGSYLGEDDILRLADSYGRA